MTSAPSSPRWRKAGQRRGAEYLRVLLPAVIFGMLVGISFIEAPLKFQAPGITIPLGLGIGRLVFQALNWASVGLLAVLSLAHWAQRAGRPIWGVLAASWLVLATQMLVIRPPLNARTDAVLAGSDEGGSAWHYLYIGAEVLMLVLCALLAVLALREVLARSLTRVP